MEEQDRIDARLIRAEARAAIKEFLDEKFAQFGWFSIKSIGALALGALTYFILLAYGWHK
jgi:hypothetical protein